MKRIPFFVILIVISLSSCKKEKEITLSLDCTLIENKADVEDQIIGEWNLVEWEVIDNNRNTNYFNSEVKYVFNNDSTGIRINPQRDSEYQDFFSYYVDEKYETDWEISMFGITPYTVRIQLCEDELIVYRGNIKETAEKYIRN